MTDNEPLKTPLEMLYHWEQTTPDKVFLRQPLQEQEKTYTWKETADQVRRMAAHLKSMDLPAGSHIGLFSKNCAHWIMADLAIMMSGHVSIPLYPTLTAETINYTLTHSDSKLLFVGKLDKWDSMKGGIPEGLPCISFPYGTTDAYPDWDDIIAKTDPMTDNPTRDLEEIVTIIYTSGTTGNPKGVVHRFRSFAALAQGFISEFNLTNQERTFSYLPMSHVAERGLIEMVMVYCGGSISFADSLATFAADLVTTSPTYFGGVPRIWVKFQEGVLNKMPQKKLDLLMCIPILSGMIKKKLRSGLGLKDARFTVSGAAPIPRGILEWYSKIGIDIAEGYGMTENMAYSHMGRPDHNKIGTVGAAMPGVEVKISDEGEILVKSPSTMDGYYKEPEKTAEALTEDGYLRTGDQGEVDADGFLKITGRVKDLFKTAKGKYVAPSPIEMRLENDPRVEAVCLVGVGLPQPIALVMPTETARKEDRDDVIAGLSERLASINPILDHHERIKTIIVVKDEWTVENKILTPTLKIKRNVIEKTYADKMEGWYASKDPVIFE